MKTKVFMTAMIAVGMCVNFASCSGDSDAYLPNRGASIYGSILKLTTADSATRGTNLTRQGDQIVEGQKVGITTSGAKSGYDQSNVAWTAQSDGSLKNSSTTPDYFGSKDISIKAYHPYNADYSTSSVTFSVATNQSEDENYLNSDLLWATATAKESDNETVLKFSHQLAKINVTLDKGTNVTELTGAVVSICGTNISTTFDPTTGEITGATNLKAIKAATTTLEGKATAIVIPQIVPAKTSLVKVELGGNSYYYTLSTEKELKQGFSYSYTLTLKGNGELDVTSSNITEWKDESNTGNAFAFDEELSVGTAGTLSQLISSTDELTIKTLKVTGNLNSDDFKLLNKMSATGALNTLDLSEATIEENNTMPENCLSGSTNLQSITLPNSITQIGPNAFL